MNGAMGAGRGAEKGPEVAGEWSGPRADLYVSVPAQCIMAAVLSALVNLFRPSLL